LAPVAEADVGINAATGANIGGVNTTKEAWI